jgi:hypothetical protein
VPRSRDLDPPLIVRMGHSQLPRMQGQRRR